MRRGGWMVVIAVAAALTACRETLEDRVMGSWRNDQGTMTLLFAEDGTFATSAPGGDVRGRYQVAEDGTIRMEYDNLSAEVVVSVTKDRLNFCQPNDRCDEFRKVERR